MLQHRERIAAKKDGCVVYINRSGRALRVISNGIIFAWLCCHCSHRGKEAPPVVSHYSTWKKTGQMQEGDYAKLR